MYEQKSVTHHCFTCQGLARGMGSEKYQRLNPVIGFTYKITPNLTAYAGYSEANRAPTPLELGCADPAHPCMIDNFLIADPPLQRQHRPGREARVQRKSPGS